MMMLKKLLVEPAAKRTPMMVRAPIMRQFSTGQMKPPTSGLGFGSMLAMGGALAGFSYLAY